MDFVIDFIFSVFFYRIGILVLRVLTFGRFPEGNSYLKFIPVIVGFLCVCIFIVLAFIGGSEMWRILSLLR